MIDEQHQCSTNKNKRNRLTQICTRRAISSRKMNYRGAISFEVLSYFQYKMEILKNLRGFQISSPYVRRRFAGSCYSLLTNQLTLITSRSKSRKPSTDTQNKLSKPAEDEEENNAIYHGCSLRKKNKKTRRQFFQINISKSPQIHAFSRGCLMKDVVYMNVVHQPT